MNRAILSRMPGLLALLLVACATGDDELSPDGSGASGGGDAGGAVPSTGGAADQGGGGSGGAPTGCTALSEDPAKLVHDANAATWNGSIVWDGDRYALTWIALTSDEPVIYSIWFALADREGNVIEDSVHRVFDGDLRGQLGGTLAVGDGELGLAFSRGGEDGLTQGFRSWFVRLDRDGWPIEGSEQLLSSEHGPHFGSAISWSPTLRQWAIAWEGTEELGGGYVHHHVYVTRVETDTILDPSPQRIDQLLSTSGAGALTWTGDRFALAINEFNEIPDTRVSIVELDPSTGAAARRILVDEDGGRPHSVALTSDGTIYGVTWGDITNGPWANEIWFRRAMVGGDALEEPVRVGDTARSAEQPTFRFDGETFELFYSSFDMDDMGIARARFGYDGTPIDHMLLLPTPGLYYPTPIAATDGCNAALSWVSIDPSSSPQQAEVRMQLYAQ